MGTNLKEEVTQKILEQLKEGIIPWQKPWFGVNGAISHNTGKSYSILNQCLLRKNGEYLTYKQVQDEGGSVKKGEKAQRIYFWKMLT